MPFLLFCRYRGTTNCCPSVVILRITQNLCKVSVYLPSETVIWRSFLELYSYNQLSAVSYRSEGLWYPYLYMVNVEDIWKTTGIYSLLACYFICFRHLTFAWKYSSLLNTYFLAIKGKKKRKKAIFFLCSSIIYLQGWFASESKNYWFRFLFGS